VGHAKKSYGPFEFVCMCAFVPPPLPAITPPIHCWFLVLGSWLMDSPDLVFGEAVAFWTPTGNQHLNHGEVSSPSESESESEWTPGFCKETLGWSFRSFRF
jgi:hypothetical protein